MKQAELLQIDANLVDDKQEVKPEVMRVNIDDLDIDWRYQQYIWQDKPFNGVAYFLDSNGALEAEQDYEDGFKRASRQWYEAGKLEDEYHYGRYGLHGPKREWYPSGQMKSDALYEYAILLSQKEWDAQGHLTRDYQIEETSADYIELQRRRSLRS